MDPRDGHDARSREDDVALPMAIVAVAVAVALAAIGIAAVMRPPDAPRSVEAANRSPDPRPSATAAPTETTASLAPATADGRPPTVGSIAVVDDAGRLSVIGPSGRSIVLTRPDEVTVGFPAWSPDGTRVAAVVGRGSVSTVEVFTLDPGAATTRPPVAVYRSALQGAFYVSWTPGGGSVSFLANDAGVIDLRVAAADRATPIDETDTASLIRRGSPLYFDWIDEDRLLAHVGAGDGAFLGVLERDGTPEGGALARPGDFRSPQVSADGRWVGWVRADRGSDPGEIVVAPRAGGPETTLPVHGPAAVVFAPTSSIAATIGADAAGQRDVGFPLGPLRLIDADAGTTRTVLEGAVVASFWSPDARTICAIRIQPGGGATAAASPSAVPTEVHVLFVDVATGRIEVDRAVQPGRQFVSELLPYFDQYELSHHLWAPDSSSFLLPVVADDGQSTVVALPRNGDQPPFTIRAAAAFWAP